MLKLAILASIMAVSVFASDNLKFETVFEWDVIGYNYPSTNDSMEALDSGKYIPKNNLLIGIKVWKDKMYLTIPRMKDGVPVTLAVTSATPLNGNRAPNLDPYPSWEMQTEGDCDAFQFVHSMEIDPLGRMWIIDTGRTGTSNPNPNTECSPRLIILDLNDNGSILRSYTFPEEVAPKRTAILNDIVLDHGNGGMAFITDSQSADPGIIVYSLKDNVSWKVRNDRSMKAQPDAMNFNVAGTPVTASSGVNGIAISPAGPDRLLYYSPLPSFHVYTIPVSVLIDSSLEDIDGYVTTLGRRSSQTGGIVMSNKGVLYLGILNDDAIAAWNSKTSSSFTNDLKVVYKDHVRSQWPDSFAIDEHGRLWYTSNSQQNFLAGDIDNTKANYRVLRAKINAKSYQYFEDGAAPPLPAIDDICTEENSSV